MGNICEHTPDEINLAIKEGRPLETQNRVFLADNFELSVSDLRTFIAQNPNHPDAKELYKGTKDFPGTQLVCVSKTQLTAISENKRSRLKGLTIQNEQGGYFTQIERVLAEPLSSPAPQGTTTTTQPPIDTSELPDKWQPQTAPETTADDSNPPS